MTMPDLNKTLYSPEFEQDACATGFIARTTGVPGHDIVQLALEAISRMEHRCGINVDDLSSIGAGILTHIPHRLLAAEIEDLPEPGDYALGMFFLPSNKAKAAHSLVENTLKQIFNPQNSQLPISQPRSPKSKIEWRTVPVNSTVLDKTALQSCPVFQQVIIHRPAHIAGGNAFERFLFTARKRLETAARQTGLNNFYIASLSAQTVVYKGLMRPPHLADFYLDLANPLFESALAVMHTGSGVDAASGWRYVQPCRLIAHDGKINALPGHISRMQARTSTLTSPYWPNNLKDLQPIIDTNGGDAAILDSTLELLVQAGREIQHGLAMLMPESWESLLDIDPDRRAFYRFHAALMEPWDGPAAVTFTDGRRVGAALDCNGLRPMRYLITNTNLVIAASEAGVVAIDEGNIIAKGKLGPGQMILVDLDRHLFLTNDQVKNELTRRSPYQEWARGFKPLPTETRPAQFTLTKNGHFYQAPPKVNTTPQWLARLQATFGYTCEEIMDIIRPMAGDGKEPTGSMGDDTALAVLSPKPRPLFHYFKQRFVQASSPAIDPLRETFVMSLTTRLGARPNLLTESAKHARMVELASPVLTDADMADLKGLGDPRFRHYVIPMRYPVDQGVSGLLQAIKRLCTMAKRAVNDGHTIIILSDLGVDERHAPISNLLAVSAVHHYLLQQGKRMRVSLAVESGEVREVHHLACLISYGANAVNPYLALATVENLTLAQEIELNLTVAKRNYIRALEAGLLKIMSKMGISTVESYVGSHTFEAIGLNQNLIDQFFTDTLSQLGGIGLKEIAAEAQRWHRTGFNAPLTPRIENSGFYKSRPGGEVHAFDPETVQALHNAVRMEGVLSREASNPDLTGFKNLSGLQPPRSFIGDNFAAGYEAYKKFSTMLSEKPPLNLRDMFNFADSDRPAIALSEVESLEAVFARFSTAAMSHGALSSEAHETVAVAMNRLGAKSNSGEGGSARERFDDERNNAIKQLASGRFGVTPAYLMSADELQIRIAQGSKPGEGGQLPGHKVTAEIAAIRHTTPGTTLISPSPHHDIYGIGDLAQLIYDLNQVNPQAGVSVKVVAEAGVGAIAAGAVKGGVDVIHIAGHSGGTGAAAWSSIKNAGLPWEMGLVETHQALQRNGLRDRVRLRVDGGLRTGRDVVVAAILGADEFSFGTAALIAEGCLMTRACHSNTCPAGIATQQPELRAKFAGKPEHVMAYMHYVAQEVREILTQLGFRNLSEIIGRTELLKQAPVGNPADDSLNLLPLLQKVGDSAVSLTLSQEEGKLTHKREFKRPKLSFDGDSTPLNPPYKGGNKPLPLAGGGWEGVESSQVAVSDLNTLLLSEVQPALETGEPVQLTLPIHNTDRTVGATLSGAIARRYGDQGLPNGTINITFHGSAGQSFGAFNVSGISLTLIGEANDYVGKGMNGGQIVARPPLKSPLAASDNVIMGNTVLYGATGGSLFVAGRAGERFAVRNSGATAVVEGIGNHGCEYMTGGAVVVLGRTGYNFGAGMSGGVAFVLDEGHHLTRRINPDTVQMVRVTSQADVDLLRLLLMRHIRLTGSERAQAILDDWRTHLGLFWKVASKSAVGATGVRPDIQVALLTLELSQHVAA